MKTVKMFLTPNQKEILRPLIEELYCQPRGQAAIMGQAWVVGREGEYVKFVLVEPWRAIRIEAILALEEEPDDSG